MKPWDSALQQHYAQTTTQLAMFWRVTRQDGQVYGWVDHDRDIVIDGVTYVASAGLAVTAAQSTMDLQPGTLDVSAFLDVSSEAEIEAGVWDEAEVTVFEARWDAPPLVVSQAHCNIMPVRRLGKIDRKSGAFQAQLHGLLEQLDTQIGRVFGPTCPWRLGDSRCQVDLGPHTHTGTVTAVGGDPRYRFYDTGMAQPDQYFNEGVVTFTSGRNSGRSGDVRDWTPEFGGEFVMHRPLPYPVEIGDTYSAVRGDDKTWQTCITVFNNVGRFGGFPFLPGPDRVLRNTAVKPVP